MKLTSAVITGATGMIGINLINRLLEEGVRVLTLVRPHSSNAARLPKQEGLTVLECGLCDLPKAAGRISGQYDAFFTWAGTAPLGTAATIWRCKPRTSAIRWTR